MAHTFFWPGRLPGFNDMIDAAKGAGGHGYRYSSLKKKLTNDMALIIKSARIPPMARVFATFEWHEPEPPKVGCIGERPLDPDNRAASQKVVFDALKVAGVIKNDTMKEVAGFRHDFFVGGVIGVRVTVEPAA